MNECSLCRAELPVTGGTVLLTDGHGLPFEVCDTCEEYIDLLRSENEADVARARRYIDDCLAESGDRNIYPLLAQFMKEVPPADPIAPAAGEADPMAQADGTEDAGGAERGGGKRLLIIAAVMAGLLLLLYLLGITPF